jgi:uncharacterized phiE125 gp8 family phage protein
MTLLDLCELADVKARLDITDSSKDALLGDIITAVSRAIEQHCQREFYQESRTRVFDTRRKDEALALPAYPVSSITSVKTSTDFDFSTATAIDSGDYDVDDETGLLFYLGAWPVGRRTVQVVYTGGIATTASAVSSNYPDLAAAAQMQVVEEYMRKEAQGSVQYSLSDGGGALNREALKLLPAVRERLAYYRRLVF